MLSIEELRQLDLKELEKNLALARANLYKIKLAVKTENSNKTHEIKNERRYIAKILTLINSRNKEAEANK